MQLPLPLLNLLGCPACLQDEFSADSDHVCLRNCTCPADGGSCALDQDCSIRIGIGGARRGVGGGALLFWMAASLALGGSAALAYIHYRGIPPWLPIRERGYAGMYNELGDYGGI